MIVCDYVLAMWQWDSQHLQVSDLQGGPPDRRAQGQLAQRPPYKSGTVPATEHFNRILFLSDLTFGWKTVFIL